MRIIPQSASLGSTHHVKGKCPSGAELKHCPALPSKLSEETPEKCQRELNTAVVTPEEVMPEPTREDQTEQGVRRPLTAALIPETQPKKGARRRIKPKSLTPSQQSALNHLPGPLAASCHSAQISITHRTQSWATLWRFLPGVVYPVSPLLFSQEQFAHNTALLD